jgi:hypothetical protein
VRIALWLRVVFGRLTVVTAWSLSCGAAVAILCMFSQMEVYGGFFVGSCLPLGPLMSHFSSPNALRGTIKKWNKLYKDGVISQAQFQKFRQAAVDWHTQRWYGDPNVMKPDKKSGNS